MLVHMCTLFMETRLCVWTSKWANSWNTHRPLQAALANVHVQSNEVRGVQILATILLSLATLDHVLDRFQVLYPNKLTLVTLYLAPAEQHPAGMNINNNKNEKKKKERKKNRNYVRRIHKYPSTQSWCGTHMCVNIHLENCMKYVVVIVEKYVLRERRRRNDVNAM